MLRKIIYISLLLLWGSHLYSQKLTQKEFIKAVQDADVFYYYDEDYEKAASLFEKLNTIYPDNSNICAKLGICYLNIDGKRTDALRLLINASSDIVNKDNEYVEYGEKAPLDTYLYLAIAYHQNDSLKKALSVYFDAKKKLGITKLFREEYIDKQIFNCRYAMEMQNKPQPLIADLFIPWLSEYKEACNPALSKNDSVFVFTQKIDGITTIYCSYKTDKWKLPVNITKQLGGSDGLYTNSITGDGKMLILYKLDDIDGNLYYSQRKDSTWSKIKSLNINTIYWESHGFITPDGNALFFASNRPGGEGDLDIWKSEKGDGNSWKRPVNCGKIINTPYNENTPFYDPVTSTLFFSSIGHVSMGGYDIFRSIYKDEIWTSPTGLPFAINNTTENLFYILDNSSTGFISTLFDEKTKSRNIFSIHTKEQADKTIFAKGTISLQDGMAVDPSQTQIQLTDQKTGVIKKISLDNADLSKFDVKPGNFKLLISPIKNKADTLSLSKKAQDDIEKNTLTDTGSFKIEIKPGDYKLYVSHQGYKTDTINLNIPTNFSSNYIPVNASLIPDKVFDGNFLAIKNIPFAFDSYKLNDQAIATLEILKSILVDYPELKIEVAGYTDSKGSTEYNKRLADNRAQAVIDYVVSSGISRSRFIKEAFGASDFIAINTNKDGSDNPEGRRYNRRAAFGIINPKTGVIIHQETYTPERLRHSLSAKYRIVLIKSAKKLPSDYFINLKKAESYIIKSSLVDSISVYSIGDFKSKSDAAKYLSYAKENGFTEAYIVSQDQVNNESKAVSATEARLPAFSGSYIYTIQLAASRKQSSIKLFKKIDGVIEIECADGFYRYTYGQYTTLSNAKAALRKVHKSGYENAFIKEIRLIVKK